MTLKNDFKKFKNKKRISHCRQMSLTCGRGGGRIQSPLKTERIPIFNLLFMVIGFNRLIYILHELSWRPSKVHVVMYV